MNDNIGPYFEGINPNNVDDFDKITERIEWYENELKKEGLTAEERTALLIEQGDLEDAAKRMTCHISTCTEDNF